MNRAEAKSLTIQDARKAWTTSRETNSWGPTSAFIDDLNPSRAEMLAYFADPTGGSLHMEKQPDSVLRRACELGFLRSVGFILKKRAEATAK